MNVEKQDRKALYSFLTILALVAIVLMLFSCKKDSPQPVPPGSNVVNSCLNTDTTFINKIWIPIDSMHADIQFKSDYTFVQNNVNFGVWSKYGCDSLKITRPTSSFYYRLVHISADSLTLTNPLYGNLKYHL